MTTPRQHTQASASTSASGIALSPSGDRVVPASVRPDGRSVLALSLNIARPS